MFLDCMCLRVPYHSIFPITVVLSFSSLLSFAVLLTCYGLLTLVFTNLLELSFDILF